MLCRELPKSPQLVQLVQKCYGFAVSFEIFLLIFQSPESCWAIITLVILSFAFGFGVGVGIAYCCYNRNSKLFVSRINNPRTFFFFTSFLSGLSLMSICYKYNPTIDSFTLAHSGKDDKQRLESQDPKLVALP